MKSKIVLLLLLVSSLGIAQNSHFWEGIEDFDGPTDENPVLAAQIDFYFDKLVAPLPDSITLEISRLVDMTSYNTDLRDFILWHLLEKYRHPEYMTQDQVFVFLYDQYFSQLEIKDLNETNLAMIRDKAEQFRRLALFNIAPNFQLNDSIDLQTFDSEYTVLLFYDHDCDLCQQEMRDLDSVCKQHLDIIVIPIDVNTNCYADNSIKNEIQENRKSKFIPFRLTANPSELVRLYDIETTPLIYVLDNEKHIIAKKIQAKQIPLIIRLE